MLDFHPDDLDQHEILERLAGIDPLPRVGDLPDKLPANRVVKLPQLFQPRCGTLDEYHLDILTKAVKQGRKLDPILLVQIGDNPILLDGHHRLEAQLSVNPNSEIHVAYFEGTVEEAVLESGRLNSRAKLPMTNTERMDYAWRLVKLARYSKRQITLSASVSDGQVATMRRTIKKLGDDASLHDSWYEAWTAANGKDFSTMTNEEIETWQESRATDYAERLSKTFGPKLVQHPEIAAMALEMHFGRRAAELTDCMMDIVGIEAAEDETVDPYG